MIYRFELKYSTSEPAGMKPESDGAWVRYADHMNEMAEAAAQAKRDQDKIYFCAMQTADERQKSIVELTASLAEALEMLGKIEYSEEDIRRLVNVVRKYN